LMRTDPNTLAEAEIMRGTETWHAAKGAYVNARMSSECNHFSGLNYENQIYGDDEVIAGSGTVFFFPVGRAGVGATNGSQQSHRNAFDSCGIMLLGLPYASTGTLKVRWIFESIPPWSSNIVTLARPTSPPDHRAIAMYCNALKRLPAGCQVGANASGDWAKGISSVLKGVSGMAISSGNPYAMAGGAAGYLLADVLDSGMLEPVVYGVQGRKVSAPPRIEPANAAFYGPQLPKRKKGRKAKISPKLKQAGFGQSLKGMTAAQRREYLLREEENYLRLKRNRARKRLA